MVSWYEFAQSDPQLAATGIRLLFQHGVGLAYFATVGIHGAPRLHPLSPVLSGGGLDIFVLPTSPKKADLLHNSRYALQTFPPPGLDYLKEGEEFYITGETRPVLDLAVRRSVISDARQHIGEDEMLFELKIRAVMHTAWQPGPGGALQPSRRKWHAAVAPKDKPGRHG